MMPQEWHKVAPPQSTDYKDYVFAYGYPYVSEVLNADEFKQIIADTYGSFSDPPVEKIADSMWLLDLTKGPSYAFKDFALQLLARLFVRFKTAPLRVLVATSGDTGAAAAKALGGREGITLFILHPKGLIAPLQRRQMTTDGSANIHNIAIEGDFDHCQQIVKTLLQTENFIGVNSVNWARIVAQIAYYGWAASRLAEHGVSTPNFVVPTGNFGNVLAGYVAGKMGVGIGKLIMAVNANDALVKLVNDGVLKKHSTIATISPSMDIQAPSNFERILYEFCGRAKTLTLMEDFHNTGELKMPTAALQKMRASFEAVSVDDNQTIKTMEQIYLNHNRFIDPHTAVGVSVALAKIKNGDKANFCCVATADAAKFPQAVLKATSKQPPTPAGLKEAERGTENYVTLPADIQAVRDYTKKTS